MMETTDLAPIARRHGLRPLSRAIEALQEAFAAGIHAARTPSSAARPGRRPYGSTIEESLVLTSIVARRSAGLSWRAIAAELTAAGVMQRNGRVWTVGALHRVATRPQNDVRTPANA